LRISTSKTKSKGMCGNEIRRLRIMIEGKIIEQVSEFNYVGSKISEYKKGMEYKLQTYNGINGIIKRNSGKQMSSETKLRMHNITAKTALKYRREAWVLNKRDKQRLEAAQTRFLRPLLGYTKLPAKKCGYKGNIESTKHSGGNSNIPEKVKRTRRADARRDTTRVSTYIPTSGKTKQRSS
jgi:hypothetical protein